MLNYNVPDLSGVKLETKKIPLKDINENSYYDGQVRFLFHKNEIILVRKSRNILIVLKRG